MSSWLHHLSIRAKLTLAILAITSVALLLGAVVLATCELRDVRQRLGGELAALAEATGQHCFDALARDDQTAAAAALARLAVHPHLRGAYFHDAGGVERARWTRTPDDVSPPVARAERIEFGADSLEVCRGIERDGNRVGTVVVRSDLQALAAVRARWRTMALVLLGAAIAIAVALAERVQRLVTRPILELVAAATLVARERRYSARARKQSDDEIGTLATAFNDMMVEIEARDLALQTQQSELAATISARTADLRSANLDLRRAVDRAEAATRAKSEFLATVSHEIRTPMNAVLGMTGLALETALTAEQRDYLATVQSSAESLLEVLNDILDFSKVEAGKLDLSPVDIDMRALVGEIVKPLSVRADERRVELVACIAADVPERVVADGGRLRQVLINLVGNALKFTETGEVVLEVRALAVDAVSTTLEFTVRDTGIGMSPAQQAAVFQAFGQADATIARRYGGTGLGLVISSRLVALMGGRLVVQSELGAGSTFSFALRAALPPAPAGRRHLLPPGLRVLVADDHPTARRALAEALRTLGCDVVPASLAVAGELECQVALVAARVGRDEAYELAARLRARAVPPAVLLVLPWSALHEGVTRAERLGLQGYLTKPARHAELAERLLALFAPAAGAAGTVPMSAPSPAPPVAAAASTTVSSEAPTAPRLRVLVAEDNPVNRKLAQVLLAKAGHEVELVEDGRSCLEAFQRGGFDLILMDLQMPHVDGLEATRRIRARERERGGHVAIVALTANAMKGDADLCREAGMDDYVSKPIRPQLLHEAIARAMQRARTPAVRVV